MAYVATAQNLRILAQDWYGISPIRLSYRNNWKWFRNINYILGVCNTGTTNSDAT